MLKNRSLQLQLVKKTPAKQPADTTTDATIDPYMISEIIKGQVKYVAIAVVGVYAAIVTLHTASEIAINAAPKEH